MIWSQILGEGATIIPVHGGYLAYYDHYHAPQHYSTLHLPLKTWTHTKDQITFPAKLRHGSFLAITQAKYDRINNLQQS